MLWAVDLGNTNVTLGVFSDQKLIHTFRTETRRERSADEYAIVFRQLLALHGVPSSEIESAIIGSVVPQLTKVLRAAVQLAFGCDALVVGSGLELGVSLAVERPEQVGADRIVNVVAERERALREAGASDWDAVLERGAIVIDLGTATTLDCLSPAGELVGGVIVPGLAVSFDALITHTAQLPRVELVAPSHVLGRNTVECLQSGIVYGYASLVDGLVAKLRAELPFTCDVVATGGLATVIAKHAQCLTRVDPDLTLRGLYILHARNVALSRAPITPAAPS